MSDFVLYGPEFKNQFPELTMGQLIFNILKQNEKEAVILIDGNTKKTATYGEILEESVKCAKAFKRLGIKKGDVVVIASENQLKFVVPVLASWYIGAVVNPLNPAYTAREFIHACNLSCPKLVIMSEAILPTWLQVKQEIENIENLVVFGPSTSGVLGLKDLLGNEDGNYGDFTPVSLDIMEDVGAILCSSGTTGFPKGVMLTHNNIRCCLEYMQNPKFGDISSKDITVSALPYFHIFGLYILINGISASMKIIDICKFKPDLFLQCIQDYKVTKLFLVPSLAVFLAKSPLVQNYDISSINDVLCGAAPLGKDIELILKEKLNLTAVRQCYASTELSGAAFVFPKNEEAIPGSSGRLVPGTVCKVVDPKTKKSLGPNKRGELCFKSPAIMKGYINDEMSTRDAFYEDGFLRSGDIGYYDEDEHFYIVDRLKELIKYKGFQVAPAEIEAILLTHDGVKEAAVVGKPDERSGELPVAFVVRQQGVKVNEDELVKFVAEHVSTQKQLHGGVRFTEEIPKSAAGKILRRKLRELF